MKKTIKAEIICDSVAPNGSRLTTYVLTYPRAIHAEVMTHRMHSKNSASSRAIPFKKMLDMVKNDPWIPSRFQKTHTGMQGSEYFTGEEHDHCVKLWLRAAEMAVNGSVPMDEYGITKQLTNRTLEPYLWHTVILSGTDFENFFALRVHPDAEIHLQELAEKMLIEYNNSEPRLLSQGEWHIPFGDKFDHDRLMQILNEDIEAQNSHEYERLKVKIATARCARVSYLTFEGKDDYHADLQLHDRLLKSGHFSPFEHCAYAMDEHFNKYVGNFQGFYQYRKMIAHENKRDERVLNKWWIK